LDFNQEYIKNDFPKVLDYLKNTNGIILDVRHKQGGRDRNIEAVVSRFIDKPINRIDFYVLGEQFPMPQLEPQGPYTYDNPVIVLINGLTFSAGELFAEMMKQLPNVTAIGDTTGGGSCGANWNASGNYYLPSGTMIHIGTTDRRRYDGLPWEWLGISPDIRVGQTPQDIKSGNHIQLEYTIDLLMSMK
jgi:C-terminal processing protease CtpA/Prc